MWKLSATRAMELVRFPTTNSTIMKDPVMANIPSMRGAGPQLLHPRFGTFISVCTLLSGKVRRNFTDLDPEHH